MPLNLITDPWLPVRRLSGKQGWIRPADITSNFVDDPIIALDFPRPDWNAAVTELLIGFLACVMAPEDKESWADAWATPPTSDQLHERLASLAFALNLGGDGARCFQDRDGLADSEEKPISALLIDAPGAIASIKNTDFFIKHSEAPALSPAYAAAALVTLQTYAPAGGQGNRTSMRGGGPLTTLPLPRRSYSSSSTESAQVVTTLWDAVWASVPPLDTIAPVPALGDANAWAPVFPWMAPTRTSENDGATHSEDGHQLQCYFGMPRRIRIDFMPSEGQSCSLGGRASDAIARTFRQKNFGVKYEKWVHPLSPYRVDKKEGKLALHPQPGTGTFRDWLTWIETPSDRATGVAACIASWPDRLRAIRRKSRALSQETRTNPWQSSVLACGFDMDNMKARGWLEARIPYFDPPPEADQGKWSEAFIGTARQLVAGADSAARALRNNVQLAKFGKADRDSGKYSLPKNSPGKEAYQDLYETFWRTTEADFLNALATLRGADSDLDIPSDKSMQVRETFLKALRRKALDLFDEAAGTDDLVDQDTRRIVETRSSLGFAFGANGGVRGALDIMTGEAQQKAAKRRARKRETVA